ncbi:hypothetical protein Hanom_Chr09g00784551 [Helianthus anomalus]
MNWGFCLLGGCIYMNAGCLGQGETHNYQQVLQSQLIIVIHGLILNKTYFFSQTKFTFEFFF